MVSQALRFGLCGASGMGKQHLNVLRKSPDVHLVAVCDIQEDLANDAALKAGAAAYNDYRTMLSTEQLDAVVFALPNFEYPEALQSAAGAEVHVLQEKPVGRTLSEGCEHVALLEATGRCYQIGTQRRFAHTFGRVPELLDELGEVYLVRVDYTFQRWESGFGWRGDRDKAVHGALLSMGYHPLDLIVWYFGLPMEAAAFTSAKARPGETYSTEDSAVAILRWSNGRMGHVLASHAAAPSEERIRLHGTGGVLDVTWSELTVYDVNGSVRRRLPGESDWQPALEAQLSHFVGCIRDESEPLTSGRVNLKTLQLIEMLYETDEKGRREQKHTI